MDEGNGHEDLWFGDDQPAPTKRSSRRRQAWVVGAAVACLAVISVPVGFALSSSSPHAVPPEATKKHTNGGQAHLGQGLANRQVLSALSATTSSGSFNVTYQFDPSTPPTEAPSTTTTAPCKVVQNPANGPGPGTSPGGTVMMCSAPNSSSANIMISGQGTIDTDPFAMVATSNVPGLGKITLRDDGTRIWEIGGGDYGLSPGSTNAGPGSSLSGFAGLVEGTLGPRQGALAMGGLASPTGYLDLDQSMITGADQIGTGTVDGVPVTIYQVSIDPSQGANIPGINPEQAKAITDAAAILHAQGYTGTTTQVSIDPSGYIRQTRSVAHFSDGSTSSSEDTFSDFGCAGTVLMPGQSGATAPPAGCVSPDTGVAPTTTTTTTSSTVPPPSTTTTTIAPPTSTTVPTTTPPSSTTSTTGTLPVS